MNSTIKVFDRLHDNKKNIDYRVLNLATDYATLVVLGNSRRLDIYPVSRDRIFKGLADGTFSIVEEPPVPIVDPEKLSESARIKFERNKLIVEAINKNYGPEYLALCDGTEKPVLNEIFQHSGLYKSTVREIIYRYIQSGCKDASLLKSPAKSSQKDTTTRQKRGRVSDVEGKNGKVITEEDRKNMNIYMRRYLANKPSTYIKCYDDMIIERYSTIKLKGNVWEQTEMPPNERPSFTQFRYYVREHSSREMRLSAKMGKRQYRNNRRALTGTALTGVTGPGHIVEMDACELDISVLSSDRTKVVGSPVVYFMVDVYSKNIIAANISFDNNSIVAFTSCLANLSEDNAAKLASYGLTLAQTKSGITMADVMPANVKPRIIRVDHGSDFQSKEAQRICNELGIELQYAPPAAGSYKSVVERCFRSFQTRDNDLTYNVGAKKHNEVSKHNRVAKLTIDDVRKLMYQFIFEHNILKHDTTYTLTPDMIAEGVTNIPALLWKHGIEHYGSPAHIPDRNQFLYTLMTPVNAKLTRAGIIYKNIRFIPDLNGDTAIANAILGCERGSKSMEVRIDPRNNSQVYYLNKQGMLMAAKMVDDVNHRRLSGLSWAETERLQAEASRLIRETAVESDKTRRAFRVIAKQTVKEAVKKTKAVAVEADTKNMRENRLQEKSKVSLEGSFDKKLKPVETDAKLVLPAEPAEVLEIADMSNMTPDELKDQLNRFENMMEDEDE